MVDKWEGRGVEEVMLEWRKEKGKGVVVGGRVFGGVRGLWWKGMLVWEVGEKRGGEEGGEGGGGGLWGGLWGLLGSW